MGSVRLPKVPSNFFVLPLAVTVALAELNCSTADTRRKLIIRRDGDRRDIKLSGQKATCFSGLEVPAPHGLILTRESREAAIARQSKVRPSGDLGLEFTRQASWDL